MEAVSIILAITAIVVILILLRWIFRINEIVKKQDQTVQLLIKLVELKKKELGLDVKKQA